MSHCCRLFCWATWCEILHWMQYSAREYNVVEYRPIQYYTTKSWSERPVSIYQSSYLAPRHKNKMKGNESHQSWGIVMSEFKFIQIGLLCRLKDLCSTIDIRKVHKMNFKILAQLGHSTFISRWLCYHFLEWSLYPWSCSSGWIWCPGKEIILLFCNTFFKCIERVEAEVHSEILCSDVSCIVHSSITVNFRK